MIGGNQHVPKKKVGEDCNLNSFPVMSQVLHQKPPGISCNEVNKHIKKGIGPALASI